MKIAIWAGCIVLYGVVVFLINTLAETTLSVLSMCGILTLIICLGEFLCKKVDDKKKSK